MVCFLGALIFLGTFCNLLHFSFVLLVREKNREESNEGMRLSIQELVDEYKDNIYAVAFNVCKNAQDAEDASIQANCTIICTIRKNDINNLSNGKCKYVILCGKNPKIIV